MGPTFGSDTDKPASEKNTRFKAVGEGVQHFSLGKVSFGQTEQQTVGKPQIPNMPPPPQVPPQQATPQQAPPMSKAPQPELPPVSQPEPQQTTPVQQPQIQPVQQQEIITPEHLISSIASHLASVGKNLYAPLKWSELGLGGVQMPPKWMGLNGYRSAFSKKVEEFINDNSKNIIKDLDQLFVLLFLIFL